MAGGIQPGMVATDEHAKKLDKSLKDISKSLVREMSNLGFEYKTKMKRKDIILIGFEPDGGLWFKGKKPIAVFEAKKQNRGGNAIERWSKNYHLAKYLNKEIVYVTFGVGGGFAEGEYCHRFAQTMMNTEGCGKTFNTLYTKGQSWFVNVDGFEDSFIKDIMRKAIAGDNVT